MTQTNNIEFSAVATPLNDNWTAQNASDGTWYVITPSERALYIDGRDKSYLDYIEPLDLIREILAARPACHVVRSIRAVKLFDADGTIVAIFRFDGLKEAFPEIGTHSERAYAEWFRGKSINMGLGILSGEKHPSAYEKRERYALPPDLYESVDPSALPIPERIIEEEPEDNLDYSVSAHDPINMPIDIPDGQLVRLPCGETTRFFADDPRPAPPEPVAIEDVPIVEGGELWAKVIDPRSSADVHASLHNNTSYPVMVSAVVVTPDGPFKGMLLNILEKQGDE